METCVYELSNQTWALTNPGGNFSNNGYPTRIPSVTSPAQVAVSTGLQAIGDGVIAFGHLGADCPRGLLLIPIGTGSDDNTFSITILGWRATRLGVGLPLWVPTVLGVYQATLGTAVGVVNSDLGTTTRFADTVTMSVGPTFVTSGAAPVTEDWFMSSPSNNAIGAIFQRTYGFRYLEVIFTTGGSATDCNALYCKF